MSEIGIHSLDHFALVVPDLQEAARFYSAFGLEVRNERQHLALHTIGNSHRWGQLIKGKSKRLHHLSFGAFENDFHRFKQQIERRCGQLLSPPSGINSSGLWFRDPDGTLVELKAADKCSPDNKSPVEFISSPAGVSCAPKRSEARFVRPLRLAHCLIFTRDVSAAVSFYTDILGLRLSDRSGDDIAFMHGIHGSDHHLIAFARSHAPGLHHCAWDVGSIDEIGLGAMQMANKGHTAGWGLGRHVLGSNFFHYVRDPWGSYSEYSCDMDYIPAKHDWQACDHDAEDAFYVWGPQPPADWTHNYEADSRGPQQ